MTNHYQFDVSMSCSGCSGAVERALSKLEGVTSVKTDLKSQTVDVETTPDVEFETVQAKIAKTGKTINGGRTL